MSPGGPVPGGMVLVERVPTRTTPPDLDEQPEHTAALAVYEDDAATLMPPTRCSTVPTGVRAGHRVRVVWSRQIGLCTTAHRHPRCNVHRSRGGRTRCRPEKSIHWRTHGRSSAVMTAAWLFGAGGVILIGIGGFFALARPALLPEDLRYLDRSAVEVTTAVPRLGRWLRWVFTVLGGYAVATGILTLYLAATGVRDGGIWPRWQFWRLPARRRSASWRW